MRQQWAHPSPQTLSANVQDGEDYLDDYNSASSNPKLLPMIPETLLTSSVTVILYAGDGGAPVEL